MGTRTNFMVIIQHFKYFWGCFGINSESWIEILIYCLICSTESAPTWCEHYLNLSCPSAPYSQQWLNSSPLPPGNHSWKEDSIFKHILAVNHYDTLHAEHIDHFPGWADFETLNQPTPPAISGRSSHSLILFLWAVHQPPFPTCPQLTTIIPLHLSAYC